MQVLDVSFSGNSILITKLYVLGLLGPSMTLNGPALKP